VAEVCVGGEEGGQRVLIPTAQPHIVSTLDTYLSIR
jgi:hypothetical protein